MAGDLIIDEWIGTVVSDRDVVSAVPKRFSSTSKKLRRFSVCNTHAAYNMYVGEYHASPATFDASASLLYPYWTLTLVNVDIYTLGYNLYAGAYATFQWIGTLK
jgi:arabinogalactan endo-1,4-beta-galactosidase